MGASSFMGVVDIDTVNPDLVKLSFYSAVASFIGCYLLWKVVYFVADKTIPVHKTLPKYEQKDWDSRAVSVVHASLVYLIAMYVMYWSDLFTREGPPSKWQRVSWLNHLSLGISMGYFCFDCVMLLVHYPHFGEWEFLGHHIVAIAGVAATILTGQLQYITMFMGTIEATTPFIHLRWYLEKAGLKRERIYLVNGVFIAIVWFYSRILSYTWAYLQTILEWKDMYANVSLFMFVYGYFAFTWIFVLNYFWFWKIMKGVNKALFTKKPRD